jgi:hypothetical protein
MQGLGGELTTSYDFAGRIDPQNVLQYELFYRAPSTNKSKLSLISNSLPEKTGVAAIGVDKL